MQVELTDSSVATHEDLRSEIARLKELISKLVPMAKQGHWCEWIKKDEMCDDCRVIKSAEEEKS